VQFAGFFSSFSSFKPLKWCFPVLRCFPPSDPSYTSWPLRCSTEKIFYWIQPRTMSGYENALKALFFGFEVLSSFLWTVSFEIVHDPLRCSLMVTSLSILLSKCFKNSLNSKERFLQRSGGWWFRNFLPCEDWFRKSNSWYSVASKPFVYWVP